mmetsp:Transcript_4094/g.7910  ORF Transcript_4094/g.7910 Transcript_4094/m.7910 type:complete len:322 (-) Transcript_4094:179-1144(-)|eukprot:CAMPEP_0175156278 /NCGR_PEP_ID=MMETSP0087-20121206/21500_1 /TAXON_ID=136419 /ORGANISM="Unknown Unknown, Strain D1" /LENGTH=321 /DNA_ID=CAMNT_0016443643 /DNA_START=107 /DNA_END=1072 /DNA_ORIENTATION=-
MVRVWFTLCSWQFVTAWMKLDSLQVLPETRRLTEPLRGEVPGNIWNSPDGTANRILCGAKGNNANLGTRITINFSTSQLALFGVVGDNQEGVIRTSIKYGVAPDFFFSPGFELQSTPVSTGFQWPVGPIFVPSSFSGPATIQVGFELAQEGGGSVTFYQCIDIFVTGGASVPHSLESYPQGFGPSELTNGPKIEQTAGDDPYLTCCIDKDETDEFSTLEVLITAIATSLVLILFLLFYCCKKNRTSNKEDSFMQEPTMNPADAPPIGSSQEEQNAHLMTDTLAENNVAQLHFSDDQDTPNEDGQHFHFRYMADGKKEDMVA